MIITQDLIDKMAYQYAFKGMNMEQKVTFKFSVEDAAAALRGED